MSPRLQVTIWPTAEHPAGGLRLLVRYVVGDRQRPGVLSARDHRIRRVRLGDAQVGLRQMDLPGAAALAADVHSALVAGVEEEVENARHLLRAGQLAPVPATVIRDEDPGELR